MTINARIKQVRKNLKLSQMTFSQGIFLSSGYYAGIELENRPVNNRIIELVSSIYGVNRQWLETGEGAMFDRQPDKKMEQMQIVFRQLTPDFKDFVLRIINGLLQLQGNTPKNHEKTTENE
jgi:transcriptional regulator with XRE-family HTH domain